MIREADKAELKKLAHSSQLRKDMRTLERSRHNPFVFNGSMDIDRYILFLTEYNRFINHVPRRFRRIIDKDMRL